MLGSAGTALALAAVSALVAVPALVSLSYPVFLASRRGRRSPGSQAPFRPRIGVVIPVRGDEEGLDANVDAFLAQRGAGGVRLVFVAEDSEDAGLGVARTRSGGDPRVRIVVSGPAGADLGKGHNLSAGLERLDTEVCVFADSDARLPDPDFLERLVEPLREPGVGLVTCVPSYRGARDLGSGLVAAMINTDVAGLFGLLSALGRMDVANGTCLAVRASALGPRGVSAIRRRLLMDSALARGVAALGYRVVLHAEPVPVHRTRTPLSECAAQTHRWHVAMRFGTSLGRYLGLGWLRAAVPVATLAFGVLTGPATAALLIGATAARVLAAVLVSRVYLGDRAPLARFLLTPAADTVATLAWLVAFLRPEVTWRGQRYRVGPGASVSLRSTT